MDCGCSEAEQLRYENEELEEQIERLEREKTALARVEIKDGEIVIRKGEVKRLKKVAQEREKERKEAEERSKEAAARRELLGDPEMRVTIEIGTDAKIEFLPDALRDPRDSCLCIEFGGTAVHIDGIARILQTLSMQALDDLLNAEIVDHNSLVTVERRINQDFERRGVCTP